MTRELLDRLRWPSVESELLQAVDEAANKIEQQAAEIERLREESSLWEDRYNHRSEGDGIEIEQLKAEIERLKELISGAFD